MSKVVTVKFFVKDDTDVQKFGEALQNIYDGTAEDEETALVLSSVETVTMVKDE